MTVPHEEKFNWKTLLNAAVIAAALGYFVDIYDLVLFNVLKQESLEMIMGKDNPGIKAEGIFLFNCQMVGMLLGGILWGIWGDKKGRVSGMFGSILLYSGANLANAFVTDLNVYAVVRVIAGIGLAGELGAGITLISETMSRKFRGYGTMLVVTFGALGAVVASLIATDNNNSIGTLLGRLGGLQVANWQAAYIVGGTMGLFLLLLRFSAYESGMFRNLEKSDVRKGDLTLLLRSPERLKKFLLCILIGIPIWYVIGIFVANSQQYFSKELGIPGLKNGPAVMYAYLGLSAGDLLSGILSQVMKSRKKVIYLYLVMMGGMVLYYLYGLRGASPDAYYFFCFLLGAVTGYWAIFVTVAAEQFGTNIRSTVTNMVPNFVRGSVSVMTPVFVALEPSIGVTNSALAIGAVVIPLALFAAWKVSETFGKDLNYLESEIS